MKKLYRAIIALCASLAWLAPAYSQSNSYNEVKVFIDADQSFVTRAGGEVKATAFIHELVAQVDAIYRAELGLTISIAGIHLWSTTDPFDRTSQSTLLSSFAQYSQANYRSGFTYDAGHLLVGSGLGGEGGIAYAGSACGSGGSSAQAYGLSQPDPADLYQFNPHLFAHELGHNLNAEHDAFPACAKQTIMCVGQIGSNFSQDSRTAIASYVQARGADGCFPTVLKTDPLSSVQLRLSYSKGNLGYKITGAENCTSLTIVASPSIGGLQVLFGYLQLGKLSPGATINAVSKNPLGLNSAYNKVYVSAYCDGQLARSVVKLNSRKLKAKRVTSSSILVLRSLQRGFKRL
jgi:hypothetical protein